MSSTPENSSATAGDEVPKVEEVPNVDVTETQSQNVEENQSPETQPQEQSQDQSKDQQPGDDKTSVIIKAAEPAKKKKKSRKSKNKNRGTGFEEFFCDPPMTPDEYEQEKEIIYPPTRPFIDRIEECVQRFRARRRMGNDRDNFFSQYLALGGVDSTTRQFQSTRKLGNEELEGLSKAEVREITADDVIQRGADNQDRRWYNPDRPEHWEVDFAGVVAGFCTAISYLASASEGEYRMGVDTVLNFLKYVEQHEVCPEYIEDVRKAQRVCETALEEMLAIAKIAGKLPGAFNTAATQLFCGHGNEPSAVQDWDDWEIKEKPFDDATARIVFGATIAILLDPKVVKSVVSADTTVVDTEDGMFEIVKISLPEDGHRAKYQATRNHLKKAMGFEIETCGLITVQPSTAPDGFDYPKNLKVNLSNTGEETFVMEESLLQGLKVGQSLGLRVCTTNTGFKFVKRVGEIRPSFYTFLPQSLMLKFKEPVPNPRPGPSIHNPDLQDEILDGIPVEEGEGFGDEGDEGGDGGEDVEGGEGGDK